MLQKSLYEWNRRGARKLWSGSLVGRRESLNDVRGLPIATGSWDCVEKFDLAVSLYSRWNGNVVESATLASDHDPLCVLPHCVRAAYLLAHGGASATHPEVLLDFPLLHFLFDKILR